MCSCSEHSVCSASPVDSGHSLDKLELKTDKGQSKSSKKGKKKLNPRQKLQVRKMFAQQVANRLREQCLSLLEFNLLADEKEREKNIIPTKALEKYLVQFEAMRTCSARIEVEQGTITKVFRCKNKLCPICNANKQGILINRYTPFYKKNEGNLFMVTLTQNTVSEHDLSHTYKHQKKLMTTIKDSINKQNRRKGIPTLQGLTKLETTYSPKNDWYHPHLHLLVVGKENAERIRASWIKKSVDAGYKVSEKAQDIRLCSSLEELFKYVTKMSYSTSKNEPLQRVYLKPLLNIYHSLQGVHSIRHFGISKEELNADSKYKPETIETDDTFAQLGECTTDVYEWNFNRLDYHSFKTNKNWGNMKLNDWQESRFEFTEYDYMFSDETKNMVNRSRGKPIHKQMKISTLL